MQKKEVAMKIEFIPSSKEVEKFVDSPEPAKINIPEWYKNEKIEYKKNPRFGEDGRLLNTNIKMCMPFLDAITSGYVQKTWCDIYVSKNNNGISYHYASMPKIMGSREKVNSSFYDEEYYNHEFIWYVPWITKTPKGYSALITSPLGRQDLPFTTLSGIVDSDMYHDAPFGNLPFYIKNNFEGLIPAGTPMYQIIPIKRDVWKKEDRQYTDELEKRYRNQVKFFWEYYKKNVWNKKRYD